MRRTGARDLSTRSLAAKFVTFACAASAGAHAGLVPEHLRSEPRVGVAFLVAVVLLLATGAAATLRPAERGVAGASAVLFGGLIAAYIASRTAGIPLLAPDPEPVDAVGVATNLVEALGLAFALFLTQPARHHSRRPTLKEVSQ